MRQALNEECNIGSNRWDSGCATADFAQDRKSQLLLRANPRSENNHRASKLRIPADKPATDVEQRQMHSLPELSRSAEVDRLSLSSESQQVWVSWARR